MDKAKIVMIDDVYGGLDKISNIKYQISNIQIKNKKDEIEAIIVTSQTKNGAYKINYERKKKGLRELEIVEVPMVLAEDGRPISSRRIREGEIDRDGNLYKFRIQNLEFRINEDIRRELKKPQGVLIKGKPAFAPNVRSFGEAKPGEKDYWKKKLKVHLSNSFVISVGDEVTRTLNMIKKTAHISIFDYLIQRKKVFSTIEDLGFEEVNKVNKVYNPAGRITKELVETVDRSIRNVIEINKMQLIEVDGEEDLAAVPAILLAPLGAKVLYGQPNEGVVIVDVGEKSKRSLLGIMNYELRILRFKIYDLRFKNDKRKNFFRRSNLG